MSKNKKTVLKNNMSASQLTPLSLLILFLSAAVIMTICSKSSPLYPFNDWDDPNCFFTVGKAMANGKILYLDIFEQKGPLLYMLHVLTYYISPKTFFGVWLFEILICFSFLVLSMKIFSLLCSGKSLWAILPMAALTYTSLSFCCGDSAEELCLPLLTYALYVSLDCVISNKPVTAFRAMLCGICAGIILWVKFTMLGFFVGFGAAFIILYIAQKRLRSLLICTASVFGGIAIASIPVIIYFLSTNAFPYLIEVYFYDNIFLYTNSNKLVFPLSVLYNLGSGIGSAAVYNTAAFLLCIAAVIFMKKTQTRRSFFMFSMLLGATVFFSFVGGRAYAYYSFVLCIFSPVGAAAVYTFIASKISKPKAEKLIKSLPALSCAFSLFITVLLCRNTYLIFIPKEEMPQFRFAALMEKSKDPTLLNYGFLDGGFYTVSGIVPHCRFFCGLNVPYDELQKTQDKFVNEGKTEYIVTKDKKYDFPLYDCIDECSFRYWFETSSYYLYRLKTA